MEGSWRCLRTPKGSKDVLCKFWTVHLCEGIILLSRFFQNDSQCHQHPPLAGRWFTSVIPCPCAYSQLVPDQQPGDANVGRFREILPTTWFTCTLRQDQMRIAFDCHTSPGRVCNEKDFNGPRRSDCCASLSNKSSGFCPLCLKVPGRNFLAQESMPTPRNEQ